MKRYLGAALLIAAAACARKQQAPTVQTAVVTRRDIIIDAQANGVIEPIAIIEVKSKAGGVITQLGLIRNAEAQMRVNEISVRASEEALRVNQQRYALGAGTFVDVLTSQSQLIQARQGLIGARLNYRNARAQIEQVIGRDLP